MKGTAKAIALGVAFAAAATMHFLLETQAASGSGDAAAVALGAVAAAATLTLSGGVPRRADLRRLAARDAGALLAVGCLVLVVAPYAVLGSRYSSAPSGTESLFFTTCAWAVVVFLGAAALGGRAHLAGGLGVGTALVGSAAMLAAWEYPSSFSPLVRFPREEAAMLAASLGWVAFAIVAERLSARVSGRAIAWTLSAGGVAGAVILALMQRDRLAEGVSGRVGVLVLLGVSLGLMVLAWTRLARVAPAARASAAFFLPPVLIAGLSGLEHLVARTPQPMLLPQVAAAASVVLIGVWAAMVPAGGAREDGWERIAGAAVGVVAVILAVVAIVLPALAASVRGTLEGGAAYAASWSVPGAETAGGWLVLLAAVWLVRAALGGGLRAAAAGSTALAAYPVLRDLPLRTLTRWIPPKVEQDYGTEYARLVFEPVPAPVRTLAVAVTAAGLATLLFGAAFAAARSKET